jgi:prepilin-type N-terminal cleavage/methylation domain-containing protein
VTLRRRVRPDGGFTLLEVVFAMLILVIVIAATGPLFFGAMRLT